MFRRQVFMFSASSAQRTKRDVAFLSPFSSHPRFNKIEPKGGNKLQQKKTEHLTASRWPSVRCFQITGVFIRSGGGGADSNFQFICGH